MTDRISCLVAFCPCSRRHGTADRSGKRLLRVELRGYSDYYEAREISMRTILTAVGRERIEATVVIRPGKISIASGLQGQPNFRVSADAETWLGFLAGERNLLCAFLTRRVRLRGTPKWLLAFKRCFPS